LALNAICNRIFFTGVSLQILLGVANAQNARIDALGGNFCIDDISAIQWNPSASVYYNDIIQGTAYQDGTFGSVIGIKSIGKNFSVGISANTPADVQSTFYTDATAFLDSTIDTVSVLPEKLPPYPHLITAIKLPFMTIGTELFHEKTVRSSKVTEDSITQSVKKEVTNTGLNLNASITVGKLGIYPFFKFAIPAMSGDAAYKNSDSTVRTRSSLSRTIKCGMELGISPSQFNFTLGALVFNETYLLQCDRVQHERISKNYITSIDVYGGITTYPSDNLLLSIVYSYNHAEYTCNTETEISSAIQTSCDLWLEDNHFTVASCELNHEIPSFDMSVIFRAGISWYLSNTSSNSKYSEENYNYTENIKYPGNVSQVVPTLGIGVQKGIISFDIASKLAGWSGIASGIPVVTGTLTLDFNN
jgi:hypothetical protein